MKFSLNLEEIKYVKILYKDIENKPCIRKAALKYINEKEVLACVKYENNIHIETPQEITLSFICNDGLYRTKTILNSVENDEPYTFFIIQSPSGIDYQQNREFFRVTTSINCTYYVHTEDNIINLPATTYDISANGISIDIETPIIPQKDAGIIIEINGQKINTKIRFVRKEQINNSYRLSFFYTDITETDRNHISQFCIKKQLEHKRNSIM